MRQITEVTNLHTNAMIISAYSIHWRESAVSL